MTNPQRVKDLADVQELIKLLLLPESFALQLNPYVRPRFAELWNSGQAPATRYIRLWRNEFLSGEAADTLSAMLKDGVTLETPEGKAEDFARLVTTDPAIARKYDMHEESEFLG